MYWIDIKFLMNYFEITKANYADFVGYDESTVRKNIKRNAKYQPTKHFLIRNKTRNINLILPLDSNITRHFCNRNHFGMFIMTYNNDNYIIHTDNQRKLLITIYSINYVQGFKAFVKFYITKPLE